MASNASLIAAAKAYFVYTGLLLDGILQQLEDFLEWGNAMTPACCFVGRLQGRQLRQRYHYRRGSMENECAVVLSVKKYWRRTHVQGRTLLPLGAQYHVCTIESHSLCFPPPFPLPLGAIVLLRRARQALAAAWRHVQLREGVDAML